MVVTVVSGGEKFVVDKLARRLGIEIVQIELSHGDAYLLAGEEPQQQGRAAEQPEERGGEREQAERQQSAAGS